MPAEQGWSGWHGAAERRHRLCLARWLSTCLAFRPGCGGQEPSTRPALSATAGLPGSSQPGAPAWSCRCRCWHQARCCATDPSPPRCPVPHPRPHPLQMQMMDEQLSRMSQDAGFCSRLRFNALPYGLVLFNSGMIWTWLVKGEGAHMRGGRCVDGGPPGGCTSVKISCLAPEENGKPVQLCVKNRQPLSAWWAAEAGAHTCRTTSTMPASAPQLLAPFGLWKRDNWSVACGLQLYNKPPARPPACVLRRSQPHQQEERRGAGQPSQCSPDGPAGRVPSEYLGRAGTQQAIRGPGLPAHTLPPRRPHTLP